jgi:ATP-dependent helicase/DNAse subunit B
LISDNKFAIIDGENMKSEELNKLLEIQKRLSTFSISVILDENSKLCILNKHARVVTALSNVDELAIWVDGFTSYNKVNSYSGSQIR